MTPEEKAKQLIDKFSERTKFMDEHAGWVEHLDSSKAKGHALTAVHEILKHHQQSQVFYLIDRYFWEEVKKEIEKL